MKTLNSSAAAVILSAFIMGLSGIASAQKELSAGKHVVTVDLKYDGGGVGKGGVTTLAVDGK